MLLDDSVRAHDRAKQAGTPAEIKVFIDLPHVFHVIRWIPEARVALRDVADFILRHAGERAIAHAPPPPPLTVTAVPDFTQDPAASL
jgi:hypothetical protein